MKLKIKKNNKKQLIKEVIAKKEEVVDEVQEKKELEERKKAIFEGKAPLGPLVYEELPENSRIKHEIDRYQKQKEQEDMQNTKDDVELEN